MKSLILGVTLVAAVAMGASLPATPVPRNWVRVSGKTADLDLTQIQKMTIGLKRNNMEQLDTIFWDVSNPESENYGDHLTHDKMREIISNPKGLAKVTSWLRENDIQEYTVSRHEDTITFDVPAAKVEKLLNVKFKVYRHPETKRKVMRAMGKMILPDAVGPHIDLISGHKGFPVVLAHGKKNVITKEVQEYKLGDQMQNVTPKVLYRHYNFSSFPKTPAGSHNIQSFAQFQGQSVDPQDLKTFCDELDPTLGDCKISKFINGVNHGNDAGVESSLDSEYITAMGRGTETWAWTFDGNDFCNDLHRWGNDVLSRTVFPYVISVSYGLQGLPNYCLGPDVMRLKDDMMKMGAMGISVSISSGDSGSAEYSRMGYNYGLVAPSFLASVPYCTAVGATSFISGNSGEEHAATFGSGGGFSFDYAMPEYQKAAAKAFFAHDYKLPPSLSYNKTGRGSPDVSFSGVNFYVISNGGWQGVGGTSCSSPSWGGMISLLNNIRMENNKTLGFVNPWLYSNPSMLTDITKGNNDVQSDGMGWYCTEGWDPATGLGTPNFGKMAEAVRAINARERARDAKKKMQ